MPDSIIVNSASGKIVVQANQMIPNNPGESLGPGTLDGIRVSTGETYCCDTIYIQAHNCADGALVDVWFEVTFSDPDCPRGGIVILDGCVSCPFFFKLTAEDDNKYYLSCDGPYSCTPGTVYDSNNKIYPWCGECPNCPDDTPKSFIVDLSDVHLETKLRLFSDPTAPSISTPGRIIDLEFTSLSAVSAGYCLCIDESCNWTHYQPDAVSAKGREWLWAFGTDRWEQNGPDVEYRYGIQFTLVRDSIHRFSVIIALQLETVDGAAAVYPDDLTYKQFIVFQGIVTVVNCGDLTSITNCATCDAPHDTNEHYTFVGAPIPPQGTGEWQYPNYGVYYALGDHADASCFGDCLDLFPSAILATRGTATFTAQDSYCSGFGPPTYTVTISGTVRHCDTIDRFKGDNDLNGVTTGVPPDTGYNVTPPIDTWSDYADVGCLTVATPNRGDYNTVALNNMASSVTAGDLPYVTISSADGSGGFVAWQGKMVEIGPIRCGYPSYVKFAYDPNAGSGGVGPLTDDNYAYINGTLTVSLETRP